MEKRKTTLLVVVSVLAILVIGGIFALWNPVPPPAMVMPVPNGYDAFLEAGALVQKQTWDFTKMDEVALRSLVEANSNALQVARSGLAEKCRLPMEFSQQYLSNHFGDLGRLKTLAEAFLVEGRLAELEKRTNDAAHAYLDAMRLGISSRGMLMDGLIGIAIESMGTSQLQNVVPNLEAKTQAEIARQLEAADSEKESWEQIVQNDKNWIRRTYPGVQRRVAELFPSAEWKASRAKSKQRFDAQEARTRRLIIQLAVRAYELEKGHPPASINDLVPAYLNTVPLDPATGKGMTL
jgi:hypothetical protein